MGLLENKIALVTGGGSGIGKAAALAMAREGATVVVAGRTSEKGKETVRLIKDIGGTGLFVKTDVSKPGDVEELIERVAGTYGRLDCAYNNAGVYVQHVAPLADITEDDFDEQMSINLKGVWLCMKYEIRQMLQQGGGVIVNQSSVNGMVGAPRCAHYSAAKHGVIGLTKTAALEYAGSGIRVNAIASGSTRTGMLEQVFQLSFGDLAKGEQRYTAAVPMKRIGAPEEAAEAVVFLCSDHASYITGNIIPVDGGINAGIVRS
jgi:NAD(P)-dependent dehydrogenase (short-subunit alcohol dehydrogenase family)